MARAKLYVYKFVTALVAMTMALALSYLGNFNQVNNKAQADNAKNHSMTFATGQEALDSHQLDKCKQSIALLKSSPSGIVAGLALESRMLSKRGHFKEAVALLSQATKNIQITLLYSQSGLRFMAIWTMKKNRATTILPPRNASI